MFCLSINMKSLLLPLLGLFTLVQTTPFTDEYLLFEPQVDADPPPLVPIPELCKQLGLNTFVKLLNQLNLTQLLETHPSGERSTVMIFFQIQTLLWKL